MTGYVFGLALTLAGDGYFSRSWRLRNSRNRAVRYFDTSEADRHGALAAWRGCDGAWTTRCSSGGWRWWEGGGRCDGVTKRNGTRWLAVTRHDVPL
jgi:hypothetical protein